MTSTDWEVHNKRGVVIATAGSRLLAIKAADRIASQRGWEGLTVHRVRTRIYREQVYAVGAGA